MQNFATACFGKGIQHSVFKHFKWKRGGGLLNWQKFPLILFFQAHKIAHFSIFRNDRFYDLVTGQLSIRFLKSVFEISTDYLKRLYGLTFLTLYLYMSRISKQMCHNKWNKLSCSVWPPHTPYMEKREGRKINRKSVHFKNSILFHIYNANISHSAQFIDFTDLKMKSLNFAWDKGGNFFKNVSLFCC